ncbi:MAG TPA: type II toxin-antitoxin system VapC family toxin [Thermoanaerobaculia bacterium]|nr:type II toxin-antitoxin system VapC family toxin [Thermoanaerobaculia bacterium]
MIVLDSSGWIEFFADGPHAEEFASRLRQPANVITPTVAMYEVYKWIKRERSEEEAVEAVATMKKTHVLDLTEELALTAADLSLAHSLAMADSMMLAAARFHKAELVTTDAGFNGVPGVTIFSKKRESR